MIQNSYEMKNLPLSGRYTKKKDEKERELDMVTAEFVPLEPTRLTFWQKFAELQYKMLIADNVSQALRLSLTSFAA